jgi:hypothetical protein
MILNIIIAAAITMICIYALMLILNAIGAIIDNVCIMIWGETNDEHDNTDMPNGSDSVCDTHINRDVYRKKVYNKKWY